MNEKVKSALDKVLQEKARGHHQKALKRLNETIAKFPGELELYVEATDVCMEAGESVQATQFLRRALKKFPKEREKLGSFVREKVRDTHDAVLGKFVFEEAIKRRDLDDALECAEELPDRTVRDLLQRTRTKKQSLTAAAHGGYSLKGEVVLNALSEALLSMRLGRMKESVRSMIQIMQEKPVENEVLQPFLDRMEKTFPKSGRIRIAHAYSLIVSGAHEKAMQRFVGAARMEPSLAVNCLDRIREFTETLDETPEFVDWALVEILLIHGEAERAAELIEKLMAEKPELAKDVMELLKPHLDRSEDSLALHYVYMNAAILAEQTLRTLETLKQINKDQKNRAELFDWLEVKSKDQFLPTELLIFHGELAIGQKSYGRAKEILTAVCNNSAADVPTVLRLLEKHNGADSALDALYREHSDESPESASADGEFEFDHFETSDFQFSSKDAGLELEPESPKVDFVPADEEEAEQDPDFDVFDGKSVFGRTQGERRKAQDRRTEDRAEVAKKGDKDRAKDEAEEDAIVWDEEDARGAAEAPAERTPKRTKLPRQEPKPVDIEPDITITEEHVDNVAQALYQAGAASFFHLEADDNSRAASQEKDDAPEAVVEEPATTADIEETEIKSSDVEEAPSEVIALGGVEPTDAEEETTQDSPGDDMAAESAVEIDDEPLDDSHSATPIALSDDSDNDDVPEEVPEELDEAEPEPRPTPSFDELFARFLDGDLGNSAVLLLMGEAVEDGRTDELRELLQFEPRNDDEKFKRECYEAEYNMMISRPAPALALLRKIKVSKLSPDDTKTVWMKMAVCQRMMSNFEAAHKTLLKLVDAYPDSTEIERLAKQNYEQYLQNQDNEAPVLEKTTSLTTDL